MSEDLEIFAQYTKLYKTYKEDGGNEYLSLWAKFPTFLLDDLSFSMYDLFYDKYQLREIGAESETLFAIYYKAKLEQMLVKYVPKIQMFITKWNSLMDRKIELSSSGSNSYFLNPANTTSTNLKLDDKNAFESTSESPLLMGTSNIDLLEKVMDLKDIYLDCLEEFNSLFILVY